MGLKEDRSYLAESRAAREAKALEDRKQVCKFTTLASYPNMYKYLENKNLNSETTAFAIVDLKTDKMVGTIGLENINRNHRTAVLGIFAVVVVEIDNAPCAIVIGSCPLCLVSTYSLVITARESQFCQHIGFHANRAQKSKKKS